MMSSFLDEGTIIEWLWKLQLASGVLVTLLTALTPARIPYGRYSGDHFWSGWLGFVTSLKLPARLGWFLQELPAFAVPLFLVLNVGGNYVGGFNPNILLLGMFLLHYFNRVFLYSLTIKGTATPLLPVLFAVFFCLMNGYVQGRYLTHFVSYDTSWFYDPRMILGQVLFLLGMAINIHSDAVLRGLRKPGEKGYKIPYGGMFEYVSGANYFGESLEWTGYAIACWNAPAAAFALWTALFLGGRAIQHHKYYLEKFEDYPKNRKAFIPFIL